MEINMMKT